REFDTVFSLAAATFGRRGESSPSEIAQLQATNVEAPLALLRTVKGAVRRVVRIGTLLEYGPSVRPLREDSPPVPDGAYARSMLEATARTRALARANDIDLVTLRPSLV